MAKKIKIGLKEVLVPEKSDIQTQIDNTIDDVIVFDGDGDKYLADDNDYKTIQANQVKTSDLGAYEGKGVEEALDEVRAIAGVLILDFGYLTDDESAVPIFDLGGFV